MLLALTILCIFVMNAYANDCVPDFHQKQLYAKFHNGINNNLVSVDEDLSERACEEAYGELGSHGFDKLEVEREVPKSLVRSSRIQRTLMRAYKDKEAQVNVVRNLPAGTKYGCNAVEIGDKTKVVCLYEKQ
ncbi:hypothetical protein COOONC_24795 [Cooperia oncophora]